MKISTNKFVALSYDLNVGEEGEKELMERATAESPLEFIYGTGSMLEAFEKNLEDLSQGDDFNFTLNPEDAYGDFSDENIVDLPLELFEQDGEFNEEIVFEGNTIPMMDASGNRLNGSVVEVRKDENIVTMDFNHPLAGETLNFSGKVLLVRESSADEIAAMFALQEDECGCGSHDHDDCSDPAKGCDGCSCSH